MYLLDSRWKQKKLKPPYFSATRCWGYSTYYFNYKEGENRFKSHQIGESSVLGGMSYEDLASEMLARIPSLRNAEPTLLADALKEAHEPWCLAIRNIRWLYSLGRDWLDFIETARYMNYRILSLDWHGDGSANVHLFNHDIGHWYLLKAEETSYRKRVNGVKLKLNMEFECDEISLYDPNGPLLINPFPIEVSEDIRVVKAGDEYRVERHKNGKLKSAGKPYKTIKGAFNKAHKLLLKDHETTYK